MHDVLEDMRIDLEMRGLRESTVITYLRYARQFVNEVGREGQRNASASRHPAVDQHAVHASSHRPMDRATLS